MAVVRALKNYYQQEYGEKALHVFKIGASSLIGWYLMMGLISPYRADKEIKLLNILRRHACILNAFL